MCVCGCVCKGGQGVRVAKLKAVTGGRSGYWNELHSRPRPTPNPTHPPPPTGLPAITVGEVAWRNKGSAAAASDLTSTAAAATVYAPKYRACGGACVGALADFYAADLALFGWERPGPAPEGEGEG